MIERITTDDGVSVTLETRATGLVRLSLDHKYFDVQRVDLTPSQAAALSRALLQASDIQAARGPLAYVGNAGEGAQGGRPQRIYQVEFDERLASQAGRINWLALVMLASLLGFWTAFGMALNDAIEAARTAGVL